jgi:hypothetical protein
MIFSLEALQAFEGDCLLLHGGTAGQPRTVLIDGGPALTWGTSLRPRLEQLRDARAPGGRLPIDLAMVSHIDGDHIGGMIGLTRQLLDEPTQAPAEVALLWHNAFNDLLGDQADELVAASHDGRLDGADGDIQAVVASVPDGRTLRDNASQLGWRVNDPIGRLVTVEGAHGPIDVGDGLELTVVGPGRGQLEKLSAEWERWLRAHPEAQAGGASLDGSVFNRSSIVVLAGSGDRRMLLTGDARCDDVLDGLRAIGALPATDGTLHVDLLKLPHHGSARNVTPEFFATVTADHYVISADGKNGNPDNPTLDMLAAARPDDDFTLHLTNRRGADPELPQRLADWEAGMRAAHRTFRVEFRDEAALSLRIDLGDPPA